MAKLQACVYNTSYITKDQYYVMLVGNSAYKPFKVVRTVDTPFAFVQGPFSSSAEATRACHELNKPFSSGRKYEVSRNVS